MIGDPPDYDYGDHDTENTIRQLKHENYVLNDTINKMTPTIHEQELEIERLNIYVAELQSELAHWRAFAQKI